MFTDKDPDTLAKTLGNLPFYTEALEQPCSLKRPVLLWSTAALVYVHGDLHIKSITVWQEHVDRHPGLTMEYLPNPPIESA